MKKKKDSKQFYCRFIVQCLKTPRFNAAKKRTKNKNSSKPCSFARLEMCAGRSILTFSVRFAHRLLSCVAQVFILSCTSLYLLSVSKELATHSRLSVSKELATHSLLSVSKEPARLYRLPLSETVHTIQSDSHHC